MTIVTSCHREVFSAGVIDRSLKVAVDANLRIKSAVIDARIPVRVFLQNLLRPICGSIVEDDQLEVLELLINNAFHRL
ncbi:MAG: hypothetical protein ACI9HK_001008 [Pirellulaceae bacterium]|jgi:hypothetical protein